MSAESLAEIFVSDLSLSRKKQAEAESEDEVKVKDENWGERRDSIV